MFRVHDVRTAPRVCSCVRAFRHYHIPTLCIYQVYCPTVHVCIASPRNLALLIIFNLICTALYYDLYVDWYCTAVPDESKRLHCEDCKMNFTIHHGKGQRTKWQWWRDRYPCNAIARRWRLWSFTNMEMLLFRRLIILAGLKSRSSRPVPVCRFNFLPCMVHAQRILSG